MWIVLDLETDDVEDVKVGGSCSDVARSSPQTTLQSQGLEAYPRVLETFLPLHAGLLR